MTTKFYISWEIKRKDRTTASYASKYFDTEAEARTKYETKMKDEKVIYMRLWKQDDYKPEELVNWPHKYEKSCYSVLATYTRI